jgi:CMP/dCMP kinase
MIISINGTEGSGKSTLAKMLAKKLGWPRYYIGGLRREMAKKRGLNLSEYNKLGETDPSTDLEVDKYQKKLAEQQDNFIIEGRTSWFFIPQSLKIYICVDEKIGAERIFKELKKSNKRNEDTNIKTIEDVIFKNQERRKSDNKRYWKYYKINVHDKRHFNFVLDTSQLNKEQAFKELYKFINKKIKK